MKNNNETTDKIVDKTATSSTEAPAENSSEHKETINKAQYVRLYADFENYKKRVAKDQLAWMTQAKKNFLKDLLPILDDFTLAIDQAYAKDNTPESAKVATGLDLVYKKLWKALQRYGVKELEVKVGDEFDSEKHEALSTMPVLQEDEKGKVRLIVSKGYTLHDKIIQVAKVIVGE